ncbi:MAG: alpha/beta hydrolase [Burkholderiaceae bacterium]
MSLYKGMDAATLEAEYNLGARRGPSFGVLVEDWTARSAALRESGDVQIDLAYGTAEREKLDFFPAKNPNGSLLIYIHGGYWQRGDKNMYSFITEAFVQHGVSVAIMNYNLTPSVRIAQIPGQIRQCIAWIWHHAAELGFSKDKITLMGHSAGGHLTALMMATDWPALDAQLPVDLLKAGIPVSGVFELEPLVHTSLNKLPQMDIAEARANSPCNIPPATNAPQMVVVGGGETSEFFRQADAYVAQYSTPQRLMTRYDVPNDDHFDLLEQLVDTNSGFFQKSMALISP